MQTTFLTNDLYVEIKSQNNSRKLKEKQKSIFRNWSKDVDRHFPEENLQMESKHTKNCQTSLTIREMQIKATVKYNYTPKRMAKVTNE